MRRTKEEAAITREQLLSKALRVFSTKGYAATTLEDCWDLVNTAEATQWHCMMLENCCYDFFELLTLNMARQGIFGDLVHGEEDELYGDQAYWSEDHRQHCKHAGIRYRVNRRAKPHSQLSTYEKLVNRSRSRRRAFGEYPFLVVKRLWGFTKVRYRGIYKNTVRAFAMFALANLYLVRRRLMPRGASYAL